MPKDQYVLMTGNPVDGFCLIGPFDCTEDASLYGEKYLDDEEYWVTNLQPALEATHN